MDILTPIMIVSAIGLLAGVILAVASIVMAVPKDEKAEALEEVLPGANCGACGYSGCSGYAAALSKGEAKPGLCSPGGADVAQKCAELLGSGEVEVEYKTPPIKCVMTAFKAALPPLFWQEESPAAGTAVWVWATASEPANTVP